MLKFNKKSVKKTYVNIFIEAWVFYIFTDVLFYSIPLLHYYSADFTQYVKYDDMVGSGGPAQVGPGICGTWTPSDPFPPKFCPDQSCLNQQFNACLAF